MAKYSDPTWQGLELNDNWRSTQTIVNAFSLLRNPREKQIVAKKKFNKEPPVYILHFDKGCEMQALEKYKALCQDYHENQVVTRGVELAKELTGVNKKNSYWKNDIADSIISAALQFKKGRVKEAIDNFRWVMVDIKYPRLNFKARKEKYSELKVDYNINAEIIKLIASCCDFTLPLSEWTTSNSERLSAHFDLTEPLDLGLKKGVFTPYHKQLMSNLYSDELQKWNFSISTIHKVKGMTLDTILLFLHKNGRSISLADVEPATDFLTENQTMLYVAMSRPRHLLAIAIEKSIPIQDITTKLGDKIRLE
jgi:hypothetical protein